MDGNENEVLLRMENINKSFPGVKALDNVSLSVKRGTVHALMGENGAGKSTLMKCLFGVYKKDSGVMRLHMINILEEYQGRGLAQVVMRRIETLYPEASLWELDTILQEEKLCHLYEKLGYRKTDKIKPIKDGMDLVFFEK